jgi:hypothetical protein
MNLLAEAMNGLGAALLQVVALLLLEELTFGGLVRLLLARRPGSSKRGAACDENSPHTCGRGGHNNRKVGGRCLR